VQHDNLLCTTGDLAHRIGNGLRRIGGRGKYFQDLQRGILKPDAISECAAAINGDSESCACRPLRAFGFLQSNSHSLSDVILSEARRRFKKTTTINGAESKDPEDVYATTPQKGVLTGRVSRELLASAIKKDKLSGSFDYAPLSFETSMVVEALRSGRAERYGIVRRTEKHGIANAKIVSPSKPSQPFPHQQPVNGIQIIARQNLQHGVAVLLVEPERWLVIDSDFKRHIIATGGLQFALSSGH